MKVRVGTGPDSFGVWFPSDEKQMPWQRFLDEMVEAGYDATELGPYGYLPTDIPTLRRELDGRGITVSGSFVECHFHRAEGWPELERQLRGLGPVLGELGAKYINLIHECYSDARTGEQTLPKQLDDETWKQMVDTFVRAAEIARDEYGLTPLVHAESNSNLEYEHQIERLMDETDPDLLRFCLDIGHHVYRGGDPSAFMRKHHERIDYLHLKNVDGAVRDKVEAEDIPFAKAVQMGVFCEPAKGVIDFKAFRDVLEEVNFEGWAIVEQDMFPAPFDKPLPIAKRTRKYLREIGLG